MLEQAVMKRRDVNINVFMNLGALAFIIVIHAIICISINNSVSINNIQKSSLVVMRED
jgi:hypothetical protein